MAAADFGFLRIKAIALAARGVRISDPAQTYDDGFNVGSFLDSEGNKLWFCSPVPTGEGARSL